jgi:hypothetical protein
MIQEALDALPEMEDIDFKSNISLMEAHQNGDQASNIALCQLADDEILAAQKN